MIDSSSSRSLRISIDWWSIAIYLLLVVIGWVNIYSAVYDESHSGIFSLSHRYGMQLIWILLSLFIGVVVLLVDTKYYHMLSYPTYIVSILLLIFVLFFGHEVNGAKAWISIGSFALQPAEFVKFTTALALARYMSRGHFSMDSISDQIGVFATILLPVSIIILQNDAGSAIVYGAFFIVLYREGLSGWVYEYLFMAIFLFVGSFLLTPFALLALLVIVCTFAESLFSRSWVRSVRFLSYIALGMLILYSLFHLTSHPISLYLSLLISSIVFALIALFNAYRHRLRSALRYVVLFFASLIFISAIDFIFDNVLQVHQQKRILDLLGMESDTQNWGYNVNQSKIAIGSGGLFGNGFLEGTQTKYNFVPEQSTDFIFSTVGEEWGFVGCSVVVVLFCLLILRLMKMGERQREPFGRIYCYSVASIFFVHVVVNIGMTIGIMPVIGIPLPFFSYGGSSFLAFTLLFFVAIKLDSDKRERLRR